MANWLLEKLNDTATTYGNRTALVSEGQEMKYGDLLCYVAGFAAKLTSAGIGKGDVCAILCDRNLPTVMAVFAIWMVGGVYLPMDPETPHSRNEYVIRQSGAKIVVNACAADVCGMGSTDYDSAAMLEFDWTKTEFALSRAADLSDTDTAYILYTSGSTGKPKGVKIHFGNIRYLYYGLIDCIYSRFENFLDIALVAPFSFDASIQQIVPSLLLGHTLHITNKEQRKNPSKLFEFLISHKIQIFDCTPTHLRMMNGVLKEKSIASHALKCVIVGGEMLKGETVQEFAGKFIKRSPYFVNVYGVTECTVDSVYHFFDPNQTKYAGSVPIGIPMKGSVIAIVDEQGQPVTSGGQGELCIGGDGVGQGYCDTMLNEGRFVKFDAFLGRIFYRTGDLARIDQNGQIICLGRNDRQVKLRGNRVELDEIESCIMEKNAQKEEKVFCKKCLLDSRSTVLDADGVCEVCRGYEKKAGQIKGIFGSLADFRKLLEEMRAENPSAYDCMLLYSGGKDSTYVLMQLIEMGYSVLAYTFDNGYLSAQAVDNILRITDALGVESVVESFPEMDEVFAESVTRYHTVCDGCYKVLATLSTKYALEHGIDVIITGLDRGQIIETKLKGLLREGLTSDITQYLTEQRKVYHYWNSDFHSLRDSLGDSALMDKICFLDYFFYDSADEKEILERLDQSGIWKRSSDTGLCSTNCRINDVGTYTFYKAMGYHNYAASLSWKIRLNQMTREEGLAKISVDQLDDQDINEKLDRMGVSIEVRIRDCRVVTVDDKLIAFLDVAGEIDIRRLREHLQKELPSYMVPYRFVVLHGFPKTDSGKTDVRALLELAGKKLSDEGKYKKDDPIVDRLAGIWKRHLGHTDFGMEDSFFDVGGDSLEAVLISEEIRRDFGCSIPFDDMMEKFTIAGIAGQIRYEQGVLR